MPPATLSTGWESRARAAVSTPTTSVTPADSLDPTVPRRPWFRRPSGLAAAAAVAASFALWTYAFSGLARKDPPDTLADKAYAARAEAVCAPYRALVDALPPAPASRTPADRAIVLGEATDALTRMVDSLRTIGPDNAGDQYIVTKWLADWDQYLADRTAYRDILATGTDAKFVLTSPDGEFYTKSMDNLATVNAMTSCATPGDV